MSFWKKRIKNVKELSKATGIEETKIKELKEGKREIRGETMENILNKINEMNKKTKLEKSVEKKEMVDWIKAQDFKKLQEDFNFKMQKDLAKAIGVSQGTFSDCIKRPEKYGEYSLRKIYNFFQNDFNKNIKKEYLYKTSGSTTMLNYLKKLGIENVCNILNYSDKRKLANDIGISLPSLYNIFNGNIKTDSDTVIATYNFVKTYGKDNKASVDYKIDEPTKKVDKNHENRQKINNNEIARWYKKANFEELMKQYGISSYYKLANMAGIGRTCALTITKPNKKIKSTTISVEKLYNLFKQLEEKTQSKPNTVKKDTVNINTLEETKIGVNEAKNDELEDVKEKGNEEINTKKKKSKKLLKSRIKLLEKELAKELKLNIELLTTISKKDKKIEKLENQIRRYEILIDRLK